MACTTNQQITTQFEPVELTECEKVHVSKQISKEDEKTRNLRKHFAQKEALRQLEMRKAHALAAVHTMSFIR